ncbi:hypothetical protein ATANTOWER_015139 [Ataeniobius toweri]|uniref:Uncharacterized protein n=1 Tax=Ataeniobius toweri TaxID=208326 RepID=A0ABU7AKE4_9TELE|nr:hypothetical protein [Ataeniobius toweri]
MRPFVFSRAFCCLIKPRELKLVSRQPLFGAEASASHLLLLLIPPSPLSRLCLCPMPGLAAPLTAHTSKSFFLKKPTTLPQFCFSLHFPAGQPEPAFIQRQENQDASEVLRKNKLFPNNQINPPKTGSFLVFCRSASRQRAQTDGGGGVKSESSLASDQDRRHNVPSSSQPPNKALLPCRGPVASPNPWPRLGDTKTEKDSRTGKPGRMTGMRKLSLPLCRCSST